MVVGKLKKEVNTLSWFGRTGIFGGSTRAGGQLFNNQAENVGEERGGRLFSATSSNVAEMRGNQAFDAQGNRIGEMRGNQVFDATGRNVGRASTNTEMLALLTRR